MGKTEGSQEASCAGNLGIWWTGKDWYYFCLKDDKS